MARFDLQEGDYSVGDVRLAIVASRFNLPIADRLLQGALAALGRHGIAEQDVTVVRVPGAFEIALAAQRLAASGRFQAIITLGAVVRGDTPHFDYVAGECARGVAAVALKYDLPVIFGVLTVDNVEQALARAGGEHGNKGDEAALAALEMVSLLRRMSDPSTS
ncbi:MAG: 6,7-dimethyl-8-ribityllumazine synthase [Gammaproteobacteria bacterium]|nr:6,7-dimethyl-8-ribityllumazine synthase [Gammaproteobacteria bacterium]NIR82342.1 6,7-dimethyl-8-ribityllumazine synthase [Gammaproteobacteria bacterium]NIR91841.1 6,7-dimethyl-8-ribityllumazine synthase [Gammaproteobacteria bacterium]NIU03492.1 6,7-dimethyl-8-ribityllumazine synthase [Gammaproteobacteria bacterium]NIV76894.1 6,7-dimethyl-8-ribityllumazine synthase [Gammaproteobacteria bacterium]